MSIHLSLKPVNFPNCSYEHLHIASSQVPIIMSYCNSALRFTSLKILSHSFRVQIKKYHRVRSEKTNNYKLVYRTIKYRKHWLFSSLTLTVCKIEIIGLQSARVTSAHYDCYTKYEIPGEINGVLTTKHVRDVCTKNVFRNYRRKTWNKKWLKFRFPVILAPKLRLLAGTILPQQGCDSSRAIPSRREYSKNDFAP